MSKNWKCIEVGNWYSEYECGICGNKVVIDDDDLVSIDDYKCKHINAGAFAGTTFS